MGLYSDLQPRRTRQLLGDAAVVLWICFWLWQGWSVHQSIGSATKATELAGSAAVALDDYLALAAAAFGSIPLLGDAAAEPFLRAAEAAGRMSTASELGTDTVNELAWKLGVGTALVPTILLLAAWLPRRLDQVRRGAAHWAEEPELLALRALSTQSPEVLRALTPDPVGDWRRRDPAAIAALAGYQRAYDGVPSSNDPSGSLVATARSEGSGRPPAPPTEGIGER